MDRWKIFGGMGWALALSCTCGSAWGETPSLAGPDVRRFAPHGIQFTWSRIELLEGQTLADGSCSLEYAARVRHAGPGCLLSVDLARDAKTCRALTQRGEPLNTARCAIPKTSSDTSAAEASNFASPEPMLFASFFSMMVLPTMYTWLGQSTRSPGGPAGSLTAHDAVRPPLRPASRPQAFAAY